MVFGFAEWIGLLAIAMVPAGGFATWGLAMSARVAVLEAQFSVTNETIKDQGQRLLYLERTEYMRTNK